MSSVDGYVVPVKAANREAYQAMAINAAALWKEHGALTVVECWGEDVPEGKLTSFPMAVKLEKDETVVFSWVVWPSRAARDGGNKTAMTDPRTQLKPDEIPFDGKRIIFGGFEVIVEG